jgi:ferredoxin-NADP reductase
MSLARKIRCTVEAIADHGDHVYTVNLIPARPVPAFRPGQFLHLTVDDYDPAGFWPESRVFSIASSPRERDRIRIVYSVVGRYTRKMEQALRVGGEVWIKLPYGDFVIDDTRDAVLIAGGTGISAFVAFLEALTPLHSRSVTLVYGARTPDLLVFRDMILNQTARVRSLGVHFFGETDTARFACRMGAPPEAPQCLAGRIGLDEIWPCLSDPLGGVFYLSGPPGMLQALRADLKTRGVGEDGVRTDAWE